MAKGELPQVIEMEKSLLGALLLKNGEAIEPVSNILSAEDFYREEHRKIYLAILRLYTQKIPPNLLSLVEELRRADELKKIDIRLITSLGDIVPTTAYAESYAQKIREKSLLRRLVDAGEQITYEAYNDQKPVEEILDDAERIILTITTKSDASSFESVDPIINRSFEKINRIYNSKGGFTDCRPAFNGKNRLCLKSCDADCAQTICRCGFLP